MPKFDFSVTTRNGQKVASVQIYGVDFPAAERKLRQMYLHCEIMQYKIIDEGAGKKLSKSADIEDLLSLIAYEGLGA